MMSQTQKVPEKIADVKLNSSHSLNEKQKNSTVEITSEILSAQSKIQSN